MIRKLNFVHRPFVMGIVNVTPDSFSGDGIMRADKFVPAAFDQAKQMLDEGADILDIGGESSRPGFTPVSADEEIRRTIPVIRMLRDKFGSKPLLSIDTVKAQVASAALEAGADIVNDVSALASDQDMAKLVASCGCAVVLMHNRARSEAFQKDARVGGHYDPAHYDDVVEDVKRELMQAVERAQQAGIVADQIILDPGLGFGKSVEQNLALIHHLPSIRQLGFPVLMGPSRKSFIGHVLDVPVDERLEGTAATVAISIFLGADIIRVHDVKYMARVAKMAAAIKGS